MFETGKRTMESVLLEHAGHDVELYEFAEDSRNGVVLWCKDCREPVIKHFLQGVWDTPAPEPEPERQSHNLSAPLWDVEEKDCWTT